MASNKRVFGTHIGVLQTDVSCSCGRARETSRWTVDHMEIPSDQAPGISNWRQGVCCGGNCAVEKRWPSDLGRPLSAHSPDFCDRFARLSSFQGWRRLSCPGRGQGPRRGQRRTFRKHGQRPCVDGLEGEWLASNAASIWELDATLPGRRSG